VKEEFMKRKKILLMALGFFMMSGLILHADYLVELKTRFYEGAREGRVEAPEFVTSSYLQPTVTATIPARFLLSDEKAQITKVFNLKDVSLIAEADLGWETKKETVSHLLRLNGKAYRMEIAIQTIKHKVSKETGEQDVVHQFKIAIFEQADGKETHLMDTDIILPLKKMAVFGFEDREGKPYLLSFHVTKVAGTPPPPPPPPPPPSAATYPTSAPAPPPPPPKEIEQSKKKIEEFEKGAVRCVGEIKPPKLAKKVSPVYPEKARQERVEGIVTLGTRIDTQGRVSQVMVYRSQTPLLDSAAIDAVKQWVYEPLIIEGMPKEAVFTTNVTFKLKPEKVEKTEATRGIMGGVLKIEDPADVPRLIKKVEPVYPHEARKALVQGVVVLVVTTDEEGNVSDVAVLKSESSLLNQASIDAVKQWKYEPVVSKGSPIPVSFNVTLTYRLK
jgi:TonB family protein